MLRIRCASLLFVVVFLGGCVGVPISSMLKLRKLDPIEADPAQIRVAILADERIGIPNGGANLDLTFDSDDGTLHVDESYEIEVDRNPRFALELDKEKAEDEAITVFQLSDSDARQMREVQALLIPYRDSGKKGAASIGVGLEGMCFYGPVPDGRVLIDIYLQTQTGDEFFPIMRNLDLRENFDETEYSFDRWPACDTNSE